MEREFNGRTLIQVIISVVVVVVIIAAVIGGMARATSALQVAAARPTVPPAPTISAPGHAVLPASDLLSVRGRQIVDGNNHPVLLLGATDYSLEFECSGDGHFQLADFEAMRSWGMNTVRITLSSAFWRNLDSQCPNYVATVTAAVANAESAGLFVILTLQWDAPFSLPEDATRGGAQCPLPDAKYDVRFWEDLAEIYQDDPRVLFDIFSEPHDIDWTEWAQGGTITSNCFLYSTPQTYQAIGIPALAMKVRAIAPNNIIIASGAGWGYDLSGITKQDEVPTTNVLYGTHPFNHSGAQQPFDWSRAFGTPADSLPVIATEFGSYDCGTSYISEAITYFKQLRISFVAWAWTPGACTIPSLLANWSGTPSVPYGAFIRQQMLQLAAQQ